VDASSSGNRALITGSGSLLNCADNMFVGLNGPGNNLVINNGGQIMDTTGYIGSNPGSDNNSVLVAGSHSVWTNITDMYVGDFSLNNSLTISNGGWSSADMVMWGGSPAATATARSLPVPVRSGATQSIFMPAVSGAATVW